MDDFGLVCVHQSVDLASETGPSEAVNFAYAALGHLDVLVNNAGISRFESTLDLTLSLINQTFGLNYRAPLLMTQQVARRMIDQGIAGCIIHTASTRGFRAYPGDAVYGGLKAALIRGAQSMALDLAPYGIRVNCVAPGAIQVRDSDEVNKFYNRLGERIPLGRAGQPQDIANAVAWLASEEASYVTGTTLQIDGGLILPGMPERVQSDSWDQRP